MRKFLSILLIAVFLLAILSTTCKANSTNRIELTVTKNEEQKDFELYILLPQDYIEYAISEAGLEIEYSGADTLKQNDIPLIDVDKSKVQDDVYSEAGIEYVQILLEPNSQDVYTFDILADYPALDMKLRAKNDEKDYIMHIDNFKIEDNVCKIEYNYDENEIKQPDKTIFSFGTVLLIVILILLIIIGIISKTKTDN